MHTVKLEILATFVMKIKSCKCKFDASEWTESGRECKFDASEWTESSRNVKK